MPSDERASSWRGLRINFYNSDEEEETGADFFKAGRGRVNLAKTLFFTRVDFSGRGV